jgi:hypothetical protein
MAPGDLLEDGTRRGSARARQLPEELLDARGRGDPEELQDPGAGVAQPVPGLFRRVDYRARHDRHRLTLERGASLPLVDKEHLVAVQVPVDGDLRARQERLGPHGERGAGASGVDFEDHLAGGGRPQLEGFAFGGLQDVLDGVRA